jgi:hypothetical protein
MRIERPGDNPRDRRAALRQGLVAGAVLLPAIAARIQLLAAGERGAATLADDLGGVLADLGMSALVYVVVLLALRLSAVLGLATLVLWIATNLIASESVRALDALPSFRDAGYLMDTTFLQGSSWGALSSGMAAWVGVASVCLCWAGRRATASGGLLLAGVFTSGLVLSLHGNLTWNSAAADWRQTHALLHNWTQASGVPTPVPTNRDLTRVASDLSADLSGRLVIGARPDTPNVLLILIESISGAYVETAAAAHARDPWPPMPQLDAFAKQHTTYATFLTHQINTNRGLYAVLCGDLPKLLPGTPKMSALAASGRDGCLPQLLAHAGYRTAYLQAAPLAFMLKDQFLPRIGFDQVEGAASFERAHFRNAWGVDDRTLFEGALRLLGELDRGAKPWFATVLTVGTHHPYLVPEDFSPHNQGDFYHAVAYADREVARFLEAITRIGVLDDTLVLVSSDESRGLPGEPDPISLIASQSWGLLVAAGPGIGSERIDEAFASSDIPLSVLDYLSLAEPAQHKDLLGRSVFRTGSRSRYVFFGNTRRDALGAVDPDGRLLLCRQLLKQCEAFEGVPGVFSPQRRSVPWAARGGGIVAAVGEFSLTSGVPSLPPRSLELMADHRIEIGKVPRMLHGGQNILLAPGEWLEVEISVSAVGGSGVELQTTLRDPTRIHLDAKRQLAAGQRLDLAFAFTPDAATRKLQTMTTAQLLENGSEPTTLDFANAQLHLRTSEPKPPAGLTILRDEIRPANSPERASVNSPEWASVNSPERASANSPEPSANSPEQQP